MNEILKSLLSFIPLTVDFLFNKPKHRLKILIAFSDSQENIGRLYLYVANICILLVSYTFIDVYFLSKIGRPIFVYFKWCIYVYLISLVRFNVYQQWRN